MHLFASHKPPPKLEHTTDSPTARAEAMRVKLNAGDMPIIRTSGNLEKWKKLHDKIKPFKAATSGMEHLAEARAEREARCS